MDPERELVLTYAPAAGRAGLAALLALDERLAAIVRGAREPTIGLMRLTWWAEALERLDTAPPPAEPVLTALAHAVLPHGVTGRALSKFIDGWERLLEDDAPDAQAFAAAAGGRLFAAAATVLGGTDARVERAGEVHVLTRLTRDRPALKAARAMATARLAGLFDRAWPRRLRALGALALLARFELEGTTATGSPRRVARLLAHRLTGR